MATKTCKLDGSVVLDDEQYKAVLFDLDGDEVWVPRSVLYGYEDDEVEVAEWWAMEHGLI